MRNHIFYRSKAPIFIILFFLALSSPSFSQALSTKKLQKEADRYLKASVRHDYFSGAVLIARDGKPVFSKGYGMANYELGAPNMEGTIFKIGSLTKQFTALAVMQLVEKGKLNVNDPISRHLKNCPEAWSGISIQNLLTHTSGIPNVSSLPDWDEIHGLQPYTDEQVVDLYRNLPLLFKPDEKYKYSNSNYDLLGLIIEKVSGISYYTYLEKNIFEPLGMRNTGLSDPRKLTYNRADGYYTVLNEFVNAPYFNIRLAFASGSLESTLKDMLLWDQALYTNKLLSQQSLTEMFTPYKNNYGYGWIISRKFDQNSMSHSGSVNGFSSFLFRFPEDRTTIIVLSNSDRASAGRVAHDLAALVFEKPYKIPEAQPYELLARALQKGGANELARQYKELKSTHNLDEELLNDLGYELLECKKIKDAIAVFAFNTEAFPQSSNVFDSLGEAYLLDNDYEKSLLNYRKALTLDPANASSQKGIDKLEVLMHKKP